MKLRNNALENFKRNFLIKFVGIAGIRWRIGGEILIEAVWRIPKKMTKHFFNRVPEEITGKTRKRSVEDS